MKRPSLDKNLLALVLLSFVARYWESMKSSLFVGDEVIFIPGALHFVTEGRFNYRGVHPPLHNLLTYIQMLLLGDNPYGWRLLNITLGSLSVGLLVAIGKKLFPDRRIAYLAGAFLTIEPMHIIMSRTNFIDISPIFFLLCGVYGMLVYREDNRRSLLWTGMSLGAAVAEKWYVLPPACLVAAYAFLSAQRPDTPRWKETLYRASSLSIVPATIYLLAFAPWFKMGHTLSEFFRLQVDMYRLLQASRIEDFMVLFRQIMPSSSPLKWFITPLIGQAPMFREGSLAQFRVFMNNPPVWLLTIPACIWCAFAYARKRDPAVLFVLLLFLASYAQFAVVDRPIFLHSATIVLPAAFLMISYALVDVLNRTTTSALPYRLFLLLTISWGIYLYPLIIGKLVPVALYSPLFQLSR